MKTRTVIERIGEHLGPVDWNYNFRYHFEMMGCSEEYKEEVCRERMEWLRLLEQNPDQYEATTDGGWPRCGWQKILHVGMYDGWPYWKPVPSVCLSSHFGAEWHSFANITDIRRIDK